MGGREGAFLVVLIKFCVESPGKKITAISSSSVLSNWMSKSAAVIFIFPMIKHRVMSHIKAGILTAITLLYDMEKS